MGARSALRTLYAALEDPDTGLGARVRTLVTEAEDPPGYLPDQYEFIPWIRSEALQTATTPTVAARVRSWVAEQRTFPETGRDSRILIDLEFEQFGTDPVSNGDIAADVALAVCQVLDRLEQYSRAHGGTIGFVEGTISFNFGQFEGGTSSGFQASFILFERSAQ